MNELGVNVQLDEYSVTLLIASLENDIACVKAGYLIKFQISHFLYLQTHVLFIADVGNWRCHPLPLHGLTMFGEDP